MFKNNYSSLRRILTEKSLGSQNKLRKQNRYPKTTLIMTRVKLRAILILDKNIKAQHTSKYSIRF